MGDGIGECCGIQGGGRRCHVGLRGLREGCRWDGGVQLLDREGLPDRNEGRRGRVGVRGLDRTRGKGKEDGPFPRLFRLGF